MDPFSFIPIQLLLILLNFLWQLSLLQMIADYISVEVAIELFEGGLEEVKGDIFRMSAYKATLETILYPMKTKL